MRIHVCIYEYSACEVEWQGESHMYKYSTSCLYFTELEYMYGADRLNGDCTTASRYGRTECAMLK